MTHPLFSYGGQITPFVVMGAQTLILSLSLLTPDFDMSQPLGLVRFGVGGATCIAFVGEVSERWLIRILASLVYSQGVGWWSGLRIRVESALPLVLFYYWY